MIMAKYVTSEDVTKILGKQVNDLEKEVEYLKQNDSRLREIIQDRNKIIVKQDKELIRLQLRLDTCLYAMILMQAQVRRFESQVPTSDAPPYESVWNKIAKDDNLKLAQ